MQGHHENRNLRGTPSHLSRRIQTIHFGHLKIKNDYVRCGLLGLLNRFPAICRLSCIPSTGLLFQQHSQATAHQFAVVHHENADRRCFRSWRRIHAIFQPKWIRQRCLYPASRRLVPRSKPLVATKEFRHIRGNARQPGERGDPGTLQD